MSLSLLTDHQRFVHVPEPEHVPEHEHEHEYECGERRIFRRERRELAAVLREAMTIGYWSVLVAAVLPLLLVALTGVPTATGSARWGKGYDNREPREYLAKLEGWRRRARAGEANGYEAFTPSSAPAVMWQLAELRAIS